MHPSKNFYLYISNQISIGFEKARTGTETHLSNLEQLNIHRNIESTTSSMKRRPTEKKMQLQDKQEKYKYFFKKVNLHKQLQWKIKLLNLLGSRNDQRNNA